MYEFFHVLWHKSFVNFCPLICSWLIAGQTGSIISSDVLSWYITYAQFPSLSWFYIHMQIRSGSNSHYYGKRGRGLVEPLPNYSNVLYIVTSDKMWRSCPLYISPYLTFYWMSDQSLYMPWFLIQQIEKRKITFLLIC